MNEKTINEQYAYIYSLLEDRRLKEALIQLESLLWQCSDWDLRTRLEQLQTSYKYMLDYLRQGANDPDRWNLYQKMLTDTINFYHCNRDFYTLQDFIPLKTFIFS